MDKAVPETTKKSSGWGYLTVRICLVSFKICKTSNVTVKILRIILWRLHNYITTFTLMLQNGSQVLVAPHFQNH